MSAKIIGKAVMVSIIGAALSVGACSPIENTHGYLPVQAEIDQIASSSYTKDQVLQLMGEPTSHGVQGENTWYYVSYVVREVGFLKPRITERQILAISFNRSGRVQEVNRYGLENGVIINLNTRETVTGGRKLTFLQQLIGGIGNFSAESFI